MQQICANPWCHQPIEITDADLAFYEKVSPSFGGQRCLVTPPSQCPDCRMQRRLAFRNDWGLHRRTCDLSGQSIISLYPPHTPFPVYERSLWHSDQWDRYTYGRPYDPMRPFLEQWRALQMAVPRMSIIQQGEMVNSPYCNRASNDKNCYLIGGNFNEDCYYGKMNTCRSCTDDENIHRCEGCYECVDCYDCYGSSFLSECQNCQNCHYAKLCIGCSNCMLCTNLQHKQYCIENTQYTQGEYERLAKEVLSPSHTMQTNMRQKSSEQQRTMIVRHLFGTQNEHATGNNINQCKNTFVSYDCTGVEDGKFLQGILESKDVMDFSNWGKGVELVYETHSCGYRSQRILFCNECWEDNSDLLYCDLCIGGNHHCFGCIGLKRASYCILNQQYTKEEYETLVPMIIERMKADGTWGEFFPASYSLSGYNETVAQDFFPLTKAEVLERGWIWEETIEELPHVTRSVEASHLPDTLEDVTDDILAWAIASERSGRPYKIIKQELEFYRHMQLPLPHLHPLERHKDRIARRNPRRLWQRACAKCGNALETTYQPSRPEVVYCEECYLKEVY